MHYCRRCPVLYYALAVLSGISLFHGFFPPLLLAFLSSHPTRFFGYILLSLLSFLKCFFLETPPLPTTPLSGAGYFVVNKISESEQGGVSYQGVFSIFATHSTFHYEIPASVWIKEEATRPLVTSHFLIEGTLFPLENGFFRMQTNKSWEAVPHTFSLAEMRFSLKQKIRSFLRRHTKDPYVYALFVSLVTGEQENPILSHKFSMVGLSHTLALSGFHYAALIGLFGFLLRCFTYKRTSTYFLIFFISLYFLFIGESPSLSRAWLAALIYLLGILIRRESFGLNALGLALLISLILDPKAPFHIGYQLTYLATFTLLTFYPALEELLRIVFPKRPLLAVRSMSLLDQHGYILSSVIRESLALTLSINLATLPLLLYYFHAFPLLSLLYNLFFPLALIVTLFGLFLSFLLFPLAPYLLPLTEAYTRIFVDIIFFAGTPLSFFIVSPHLSPYWPGFTTLLLIPLGLFLEERTFYLGVLRENELY